MDDIFPISAYENTMENFQAQTKNLYMCMGHLEVWKKSHTFILDIYDYFLHCAFSFSRIIS